MLVQEVAALILLVLVHLQAENKVYPRTLELGGDRHIVAFEVVDILPC